jgi:hypothetical protein
MSEISVGVYHSRALQLAEAMKLCWADLSSYAAAAALLAVHSAISYNDALLIKLTGKRPRGRDHKQAVKTVIRACEKASIPGAGIQHLNKLVNAKTEVSYGEEEVDNERVHILCLAAEQFYGWVEPLLKDEESL